MRGVDSLLVQAVQSAGSIHLLDSKADAVLAAGLRNHDHIHIGVPDSAEDGAGCSWHPHHPRALHHEGRALLGKTRRDRTGEDRTGEERTGQGRAGQDRTGRLDFSKQNSWLRTQHLGVLSLQISQTLT